MIGTVGGCGNCCGFISGVKSPNCTVRKLGEDWARRVRASSGGVRSRSRLGDVSLPCDLLLIGVRGGGGGTTVGLVCGGGTTVWLRGGGGTTTGTCVDVVFVCCALVVRCGGVRSRSRTGGPRDRTLLVVSVSLLCVGCGVPM